MPNPRTPSPADDLRAVLERELEQRRGRGPEPGEIFVLPETAELPVEWALLEARRKSFLAIPVDTQPLAGSRDFALGPHVLSGPLSLRCGHAVEIATTRLRPELRTGLLDLHSLAAVRSLQAALANGTAAKDPMGEEVDRDPEYRDWVEEVLDPARAVMAGLGEGGKDSASAGAGVVKLGDWRERQAESASRQGGTGVAGWVRRASPWLAAALLAVSLGLGWQLAILQQQWAEPLFDQPSFPIDLSTSRGEETLVLPVEAKWVRLAVAVPDVVDGGSLRLIMRRPGGDIVAAGPPKQASPGDERSISVARHQLSSGLHRLQLVRVSDEEVVAERILRFETKEAAGSR